MPTTYNLNNYFDDKCVNSMRTPLDHSIGYQDLWNLFSAVNIIIFSYLPMQHFFKNLLNLFYLCLCRPSRNGQRAAFSSNLVRFVPHKDYT